MQGKKETICEYIDRFTKVVMAGVGEDDGLNVGYSRNDLGQNACYEINWDQ